MNTAVHFSSAKDDWETPDALFAEWDALFHFDLDAAAHAGNHKVARWLGPGSALAEDALAVRWRDFGARIWLNPPYGRQIGRFTAKAVEAYRDGAQVVALLPSRTDTAWWHRDVMDVPMARVQFLRGRVRFKGAPSSAPFPSAVVAWSDD